MVDGRWGLVALLTVACPADAQTTAPPPADSKDIIVTAVRSTDYRKQLDDCIAHHCPPNREIAATLALAEEQFSAGDYEAARMSLGDARRRNARFARQYPVALANLYHANALVARNLGDADSEYQSTVNAISAMKAGLPNDDPRVFLERIELGDTFVRTGRFIASEQEFESVAARAHALGLKQIEGTALLRLAFVKTRLAVQEPARYSADALRAIKTIEAISDPDFAAFVTAARMLRVQLASLANGGKDIDALVAHYRPLPAGAPAQLLYAPQINLSPTGEAAYAKGDTDGQTSTSGPISSVRLPLVDYEGQWIDVAFTIGRDGRVSDTRIDRHGEHVKVNGGWAVQVVAAIAARRYVPQTDASTGRERYTFTSDLIATTGSHLRDRSPAGRLEQVDLTGG